MLTELDPATAAVTPAEFAAHLRMPEGFGEEWATLEPYARAATAAVEAMTGKALIRRRFKWTVTEWRDAWRAPIPVAPVVQVNAVTLVDRQGGWEAVDLSRVALEPDAFRPRLKGAGALSLPGIPRDGLAEVELVAGCAETPEGVPADLRHAVLLLGAQFHEQRHVSVESAHEAPLGVRALVAKYREVRL